MKTDLNGHEITPETMTTIIKCFGQYTGLGECETTESAMNLFDCQMTAHPTWTVLDWITWQIANQEVSGSPLPVIEAIRERLYFAGLYPRNMVIRGDQATRIRRQAIDFVWECGGDPQEIQVDERDEAIVDIAEDVAREKVEGYWVQAWIYVRKDAA